MKKFRKGLSGLLAFVMALSAMLCNMAVTASAAEHTVWIVGDSTGCHYDAANADKGRMYKRVGFGDKIADYLADSSQYEVRNLALSGKSSKSFLKEDNYTTLTSNIKQGDYLIIAFGHNDEKTGNEDQNGDLFTSPSGEQVGDSYTAGSFKQSLYDKYVKVATDAEATPILCSPIVRLPSKDLNWSDKDLHKVNGGNYAEDVKNLANDKSVAFIDLTNLTKTQYETATYEEAKYYHSWENETTIDHTHLSDYGASVVAYLMAKNAPDSVKALFKTDLTAPTKNLDEMKNPDFVPTPQGDLTEDYLSQNKSDLWIVNKEHWFGSAFGNISGNPSSTNFTIEETSDGKVHMVSKNSRGKLTTTNTGLAMYFTPISASGNYLISADVEVNSVSTSDNQSGFGAIIIDEVLNNANSTDAFSKNYVAATPFYLSTAKPTAGIALKDNAIEQGPVIPAKPAKGDKVNVTIVKIQDKYTTAYKTPYGTFVKQFDMTDKFSGMAYAGLFVARDADVTFSNISTTIEVNEEDNPIKFSEGTVKYTQSPENGTVKVEKVDNSEEVTSDTKVAGGTKLKLTATPTTDGYYPSVKVGTTELILDNNSYTWEVDGDIEFTVDFITENPRTAINEGKIEWTGESGNNDIVQQVNQHLSGPYYFELEAVDTNTATLDTANKRINIGSKAGIKFSTGDLVGKEAYLTVSYATSGDDDRNLMLKGGATDVTVGSTNGKGNYVTNEKKPVKLEAGKTYSLVSNTKAIYVNKITVDVKAQVQVTPSFKIDGTDPVTEGTYTINGQEYTVGQSYFFNEGEYPLVLTKDGIAYSGTLTVTQGVENPEVTLTKIENVTFKGTVTVQGKTEIPDGVTIKYKNTVTNAKTQVSFDKSNGTYEMQLAPGTYEVEASELEGYTISTLSSDEFTVSASDTANNFNNVLYKKNAVPATASNKEIYVDPDDTSYDGVHYPTVNEAIAGIKASSISSSATDKWTVRIKAGTYREQIIVDANNVTLTSDYNGNGNFDDGEVTLTWYYGVGYKYYSIKPVPTKNTASSWSGGSYYRGLYDIEYAYDKHNLTATVDRWGTAVQVTGDNFYAEGITFENSFNRYMTQDEIDDGVTLATAQEIDANKLNTEVVRTIDTDVKAAAATERAAALVLDNAKASIYKCKLKSSQDTLYVKTGLYYFKDCEIMGQTDYIFGGAGSFTAFDDCKLLWSGYNNVNSKPGYITATQGKIILRNCSVESGESDTNADKVEAGYYGRPWGTTADVTFIDTQTNGLILQAGWDSMSGVDPDQVKFYEYNNKNGEAQIKTDKGQQLDADTAATLTAENDYNFYSEDWLPEKHVPYVIPEIEGSLVTWNFKTRNTSLGENGAIQSKTGTVTVQDDKLGTVALNVDATSGKLQQRNPDADAQFNENTKITIPVYQAGDIITINAYDTQYSVKDKPAESATTEITAEADDVGKGIDLVATGNTYLYSISLRTLYEPVPTTKVTWDFHNPTNTDLTTQGFQGSNNKGSISLIDGSSSLKLEVDASDNSDGASPKFAWNQSGYAQFNKNTVIKVPVFAVGDKITVEPFSGQGKFTIGNGDTVITGDISNPTTYTATATDLDIGSVSIKASDNGYIYSISLETTADIPEPTPTRTVKWDFQTQNTDLPLEGSATVLSGTTGTVAIKNGPTDLKLEVDASSGKLSQRTQNDAQFNNGAIIKIPAPAEKDTIKITSYHNYHYYDVVDHPDIQIDDVVTYTVTAEDAKKGYIEIEANDANNSAYLYSIELTTTAMEIPEKYFVFDKAVKGDGNVYYLIGKIGKNVDSSVTKIGFNAALSEGGVKTESQDGAGHYAQIAESDTAYTSVVDDSKPVMDEVEGTVFGAVKLDSINQPTNIYVATYSLINGQKVYDAVHEVAVAPAQ